MKGIVSKIISDNYTILINKKEIVCKARGKFRKDNVKPIVGDKVLIDFEKKYILEIKPRKNKLNRPVISNVDQVVLIMSVKEPDFQSYLLDKLLIIIEYNNIKPIICFTKLDLLENKTEIIKYIDYYKKIGYEVLVSTELKKLKALFKNKTTVFAGQSGVGKSTLLNELDNSLNLKIGSISKYLGRGKHTTRHVELIQMFGGLVADTPGFSVINFNKMTKEDIRDNMREFNLYSHGCEYRSCLHNVEKNCLIKEKVKQNVILKSRHINYLKFLGEIE